jgi:hypothetical protein
LLGLKKGRLLARHAHFRAPLFGAFPLKPTIDGNKGQQIFNALAAGAAHGHPGDGLFRTLRDLGGDGAPSKHAVRTATEGLTLAEVADIVRELNMAYASGARGGRSDPWRMAQRLIDMARSRR